MKKTFSITAVVAVIAISVAGYAAFPARSDQTNTSVARTTTSMTGVSMHDEMGSGMMAAESMHGSMNEASATNASGAMVETGMMTDNASMSKGPEELSSMMANKGPEMTEKASPAMTPAMVSPAMER